MSDVSKSVLDFRAEFEKSACRLFVHVSADGMSSVVVESKPVYKWLGKNIEAVVYEDPGVSDTSYKFFAEIRLLDSTKIIGGDSVMELRTIAFWVDRCIERFLIDGALCILDEGIPF